MDPPGAEGVTDDTSPPDSGDAYDQFATSYRKWKSRGKGRSTSALLDDAPMEIGELRAWFCTLPLDELAGVWVAAVVDAYTRQEPVSALATTLCVVAERLHGVKFQEIIMAPTPATLTPPPAERNGIKPKATPMGPPAPEGVEAGFGEAPPAKAKPGRHAEIHAYALTLPEGGWFVWKNPPGKPGMTVSAWNRAANGTRKFETYKSATTGEIIVRRRLDPAKPKAA